MLSVVLTNAQFHHVEGMVYCYNDSTKACNTYSFSAGVKEQGSVAVLMNQNVGIEHEDNVDVGGVSFSVSSLTFKMQVSGVESTNLTWFASIKHFKLDHN